MDKQVNLMRNKECGDYLISTLDKESGMYKSLSLNKSELLELYNLIDLLKWKSCYWCKNYVENGIHNKCRVNGIFDYDSESIIDCDKCEFDSDRINDMLSGR